MKRIRKSRSARILSWLLTVVMITPLLCEVFGPQKAMAQQSGNANSSIQTVIVIDFVNKSGILGNALVRDATDAVANELTASNRFEVLGRTEVLAKARELGYKAPYSQIELSKLAMELGASEIVTGDIATVKADTKHGPKTVSVGLNIRVTDAASSDPINGAAKVGQAIASPGLSDDESLARKAVGEAAVLGVKQILSTNLAEGIILITSGDPSNLQILINRGSRDGVKIGMDFLVTRDRQKVGKIRVSNVFPTESEATLVSSELGLRPQDRVRALFPMPELVMPGQVVTTKRSNHNFMSDLGKVALALVVGVVVVSAVQGGKNSTITGVVAEPTLVSGTPAVTITWRDNMFGGNTTAYSVWRNPDVPYLAAGTPVALLPGGTYNYIDMVKTGTATNPSIVPGTSYTYPITATLTTTTTSSSSTTGSTGSSTTTTTTGTSAATTSSQATPVNQPILSLPLDTQGSLRLDSLSFSWQGRRNVDEYVIEISTDSSFRNRNVIRQSASILSNSSLTDMALMSTSTAIDITNDAVLKRDVTFANYVNRVAGATRPTLYWRVGGRNSMDSPGPVEWFTRNPHSKDRAFRWIYSTVRSFTPADMPPTPPSN